MKSIFTIFSCAILLTTTAQVSPCYTHEAMMEHETKNPGYLDRVNEVFERAKYYEHQDRSEDYIIPVVVHIVYNTPEENLHDSVIFNQIESLNADFRRLNEDASNLREDFATIVGDTHIGFQLAQFDPEGNPTNGITRTSTDVNSFLDFSMSPAEGVKQTSAGGIDPWDQSRYLNIWVCDMSLFGSVFLLGYATPPAGLPHWPEDATDGMSDGVVIQYQVFGSNNPNPVDLGDGVLDVRGRTATHEVGHYLGLRHIWGDGDCTAEDGVDDTPNAAEQSNQDCDTTKNSCVDDIAELGDLPDMVENFMDYSAETCQNSFTLGQIDIMRGVLEIQRINLIEGNPALSIDEDLVEFNINIFPNPSEGNVTLTNKETELTTIQIYDETGKIINSKIMPPGSTLQIADLPSGFYIIRFENKNKILTEKLVVY
jgi:hypothetical protein